MLSDVCWWCAECTEVQMMHANANRIVIMGVVTMGNSFFRKPSVGSILTNLVLVLVAAGLSLLGTCLGSAALDDLCCPGY